MKNRLYVYIKIEKKAESYISHCEQWLFSARKHISYGVPFTFYLTSIVFEF